MEELLGSKGAVEIGALKIGINDSDPIDCKYKVSVHTFVLMTNHVHLLVTPASKIWELHSDPIDALIPSYTAHLKNSD